VKNAIFAWVVAMLAGCSGESGRVATGPGSETSGVSARVVDAGWGCRVRSFRATGGCRQKMAGENLQGGCLGAGPPDHGRPGLGPVRGRGSEPCGLGAGRFPALRARRGGSLRLAGNPTAHRDGRPTEDRRGGGIRTGEVGGPGRNRLRADQKSGRLVVVRGDFRRATTPRRL
jgi:hypothetical protein